MATVQEVNWYRQELINLYTSLANVSAFIGFQHHVTLPNILANYTFFLPDVGMVARVGRKGGASIVIHSALARLPDLQ